ncbi:glycosyltransferase family 2 protein [Rhizobiaceae bacterium BDR2-2]|uniref:Glycosyltransferase family 2 protein n=1 Tax=Ectorhizobium quercum TaxID=2965071 RepID=A0AAE3N1Z7_9HYPH|nr:glycosyltransferase family 2 protein [Ectorhizobium quercum]MCX8996235.1 glycosyltransferase family 2 protein [Ectorhizobium quercum]MCX8998726.1 glycosyltransferase family 2 protein [Ectorhizobium quercum]
MDFADRVTAVFTTFNSAHVIGKALQSLPDGVRVIVVDNASRDDTAEQAKRARASVEVISLPKNVGFGRGCNVGLRLVETDYAVVINPDLFVGEDCLSVCVAAADAHPEVALFGPREETGGRGDARITDVDYCEQVSGAFMFMRMSAFRTIGFFDENIFMYFEDNDLCLRTRDCGYRLARVLRAETQHIGAGSTQKNYDSAYEKSRLWGSACAYFADKYKDSPEGKAAGRKLRHYYIKYYKNLVLDRHLARIYAERIRGWKEYSSLGPGAMFDNTFVTPANAKADA